MALKARSFELIWNPDETWPADVDLENDLARFLASRNLEATKIASLTKDPLRLWIVKMKAAPQVTNDPLIGVKKMFDRVLREEWVSPKVHEERKKYG